MEILYGLHPVEEALRAGSRKFDHVCIGRERHDERLQRVIDLCRDLGVRLRFEPRDQLTQLAKSPGHQGVVAVVRAKAVLDLEDLFVPPAREHGESAARLLLALDGIEDPQNLGALLRTADGSGVDGVIVTERRTAPLSAVAVKASAGAAEHVRIARVVNMTRSLERLKEQGIWCIGLDERGEMDYDQFDYTASCVLVLGREGAGLHDLVKKTCDQLLRIPMAGRVSSLNVSVAGAVVLYEAARQRRSARARESAMAAPAPAARPRKQKGLSSFDGEAAAASGVDNEAGWDSPASGHSMDIDRSFAGQPGAARVAVPATIPVMARAKSAVPRASSLKPSTSKPSGLKPARALKTQPGAKR
jgi:23S rRNA (guanosine2251-2'-O)-methyltransferase